MKKVLFAFLLLAFCLNTKAESILENYYSIVSDDFNNRIKQGNCLVTGKVTDMNGQPIVKGTIANFSRSKSCVTDSKGNYSLTLSSKDTALFFYHENYGEIVIWKYNFQSQHIVVIDFHSAERSELPIMVEKPVIYFYAENDIDFSVTLNHPKMIFTYPDYKAGWNFTATASGDLMYENNKNYPYLFWEGEHNNLAYQKKNKELAGFFIATDSTIQFLENSLAQLGLNEKESADFITYWGPRLVLHKYAFVQFLIDEDYASNIAEISVSPKPESQRRVYLLFTSFDYSNLPFEFTLQELPEFERSGFTLIEWGGSELKQIPISM